VTGKVFEIDGGGREPRASRVPARPARAEHSARRAKDCSARDARGHVDYELVSARSARDAFSSRATFLVFSDIAVSKHVVLITLVLRSFSGSKDSRFADDGT